MTRLSRYASGTLGACLVYFMCSCTKSKEIFSYKKYNCHFDIFLNIFFLFHIASVYPAAKWVPSINKAVLRACALYAASCSGISPGGLKWFPCVQAR